MLDEAGVLIRVERLAGSGYGALVATLLALGYSPKLIDRWLNVEVPKLISGRLLSMPSFTCLVVNAAKTNNRANDVMVVLRQK